MNTTQNDLWLQELEAETAYTDMNVTEEFTASPMTGPRGLSLGNRNIPIVIVKIFPKQFNDYDNGDDLLWGIINNGKDVCPITYVSKEELKNLKEYLGRIPKSSEDHDADIRIIELQDPKGKPSHEYIESLIEKTQKLAKAEEERVRKAQAAAKKAAEERAKKAAEAKKVAEAAAKTREITQMKKLIKTWGKELLSPGINCPSIVELSDKQLLEVKLFNKLFKKYNTDLS